MTRDSKRSGGRSRTAWSTLPEDELLGTRLRDLPLTVDAGSLARRLDRLDAELARRGLRFRPHVWLSSDFFSVDGVPGVAVPFYLAHPRLIRLERTQVGWAEGASESDGMRLLRHEAGHAIDTAFELSRRRDWREAFGLRSAPYRRVYTAEPRSSEFVRHLPRWYAQSHPAEDFAETFAVWLTPRATWRRAYPGGVAREKLELVDRMMAEIAGERPTHALRERPHSLPRLRETLGEHYAAKRRRRLREPVAPYEDTLLGRYASVAPMSAQDAPRRSSSIARAIREASGGVAKRLRSKRASEVHALETYALEQVLEGMRLFAHERGLELHRSERAPTLSSLATMVEETIERLATGDYRLAR